MSELRITRTLAIPLDELEVRFSRSGGPGGQNVNRRETKVEVRFDVGSSAALGPRQRARILRKLANRIDGDGVLRVVSSETRSQGQNREAAMQRLAELLADALKQDKPRRSTRPSAGATQRRLDEKRRRSERKRERAWRGED